ncbi:dolichol kinase EVAN [Aristolochia californica]|uniref:dolichol kinase EVAN n=1 Tax=Aristolochia californica TaxID=171875 RepID=UPI0035E2E3A7
MAAASLCNGERAVVLLYLSGVVLSAPISLLLEAGGLCILAFGALLVEIASESSNALSCLKTRQGASTGILLGTVTLPTVMFSRLMQMLRALSIQDVSPEEIGYIKIQYWAVSVSCICMLIFLCGIRMESSDKKNLFKMWLLQDTKCTFLSVSYAALCFISLVAKSYSDVHVAMKLSWIFFQGVASVKLIQHILYTFPFCASIGEAFLATSGLVLFFGDMTAFTLSKLSFFKLGIGKSEISIIVQGLLLGLLLLPFFFKVLILVGNRVMRQIKSIDIESKGSTSGVIGRSIVFYASLGIVLILLVPAWMLVVHDFGMHPIIWMLYFVFTGPQGRMLLCIYWMVIMCLSVVYFYNVSKSNKVERILLRKYYHLVAVLMFVPALLFQPSFLDLSFGVALAGFLALEIIRVWQIWPLGHIVDRFMNAFTDHRDSDILIVSHFSLLLGCAIPKWMSSGFNDRPLAPFAGILSLGIGDTMASVVGHKYGVLRWSKTGKKTVEGTAAGIMSVFIACSVLIPFLASTGYILSQHWVSLLMAIGVSGLLEANTVQLDNAFIPLVFYSLLCL